MRRAALLACVALAVALGAWWLFAGDAPPAPTRLPPAPAPPPPRVVGEWHPPGDAGVVIPLVVSVTEHGAAVAGAAVHLGSGEQSVTDAMGAATFRLAPGTVQVTASAHGLIASRSVALSTLNGDARVELPLDVRSRFELVLTDGASKAPLKGARVLLGATCEPPLFPLASTVTDESGRAVIEGLPSGEWLLTVELEGYRPERCAIVRAPSQHALMLAPLTPLSGRILHPDGAPAAGAEVTLLPFSQEDPAHTVTVADGTFTLPAFTPRAMLCARLGELSTTGRFEDAADAGLRLAPTPRFQGQVLRTLDDTPLDAVRISIRSGAWVDATTTADGGLFSLTSSCGSSPVATFERDGFVTELEGLNSDEPNVVRLSAPAAVRGRVVDDEGRPVANARVELVDPRTVTLTDADGRFGFERAKHDVLVRVEEGERGGSAEAEVDPGQLVELTVNVGPVLVQVPIEVLYDNQLADGVWDLTASRLDGRPFETHSPWHGHGRISDVLYPTSLRLPEGSFHLEATSKTGEGQADVRVRLEAEQKPVRIHATRHPEPPPEPTRDLHVRVVDAKGEPVAGAEVRCLAQKAAYATSGADGRCVCAMPIDSTLPTEARAQRGGAIATVVPSDWASEVVLNLRNGITLRGTLIGDPGPQYQVELSSKFELKGYPGSGPQFVIEDRPATRSILCVLNAEAKLGCAVAVPADGDESVNVTIPLGPPGTLHFSVYARGQRVDQPVLYVDRNSTRAPVADGVVSLALAPGQHLLVVNVADGPERYETVLTIESGRVNELGRVELR
jgi:hypothetical protein